MLEVPLVFWIGFLVFVLAMLALDLGVFNRKAHTVSVREAGTWTAVWVSLALIFNLGLYFVAGPQIGLEFLTGYLIEYSLSVDNIFVFVLIFSAFAVPPQYQHRVLFWGILGALVMRGAMIALGAALIANFHWIIYVFGAFLVFAGVRMFFSDEGDTVDLEKNAVLRFVRRLFPVTDGYREAKFTVLEAGRRMVTPLLLVSSHDRADRFGLRARLDSGDFCDYSRAVYRLYQQHLRYFRLAEPVLFARRGDSQVRLLALRFSVRLDLCRRQDAHRILSYHHPDCSKFRDYRRRTGRQHYRVTVKS